MIGFGMVVALYRWQVTWPHQWPVRQFELGVIGRMAWMVMVLISPVEHATEMDR